MSDDLDQAQTVCAEAYQLVGSLMDIIPDAEKWLDNLSQQKEIHKNLLPLKPFTPTQLFDEHLPPRVKGMYLRSPDNEIGKIISIKLDKEFDEQSVVIDLGNNRTLEIDQGSYPDCELLQVFSVIL